MNNRYTFKAKRKDNGEWVYGNIIDDKFIFDKNNDSIWDGCYYDEDRGIIDGHLIEIIPETLCQCTGHPDAEGNYIFENDIFNTFDKNGNIISTFVIIWNEIEISYEILDYNTKNHFTFDSRCMLKKCKVIGNKFDEVVE